MVGVKIGWGEYMKVSLVITPPVLLVALIGFLEVPEAGEPYQPGTIVDTLPDGAYTVTILKNGLVLAFDLYVLTVPLCNETELCRQLVYAYDFRNTFGIN